jgi:hypothetical protein
VVIICINNLLEIQNQCSDKMLLRCVGAWPVGKIKESTGDIMCRSIGKDGRFSCKKAVLNAYRNLRMTGVTDPDAFHAAVRVYRQYHPEITTGDANFRVADWIGEVETVYSGPLH